MATHLEPDQVPHSEALRLHALKNCAATISVLSRLLAANTSVNRGHLDRLQETAERMARLLCESLERPHIEQLERPQVKSLDVSELLRYVNDEAAPRAEASQVQLEFSHRPASVRGSAHDLGEALLNLVNNAIEASPPGGHVKVVHTADASGAHDFAICDEGRGMSAELVCDAGRRRVRSSKQGGSGVGLVLARRVVENQGGKLDVSSSSQGTTVRVLLPAA